MPLYLKSKSGPEKLILEQKVKQFVFSLLQWKELNYVKPNETSLVNRIYQNLLSFNISHLALLTAKIIPEQKHFL